MTNTFPKTLHALTTITLPDANPNAGWGSMGTLVNRGQQVEISQARYDATKDVNGDSWLDYSEDEQQARWNEVRFRWGETPDNVRPWDKDPSLANLLRETELAEARKLENTAERADAVAAIFQKYGRGQTSQTIAYIG
ncbi:hypothetical protein FHS07_002354 [Microbacterium proteolyticum]|uniref:Uncharacterized protein n=1 Tax=Microbacterium proteolyticum TaxID=1572644 RepID=A0A7W5CJ65_9MICO|nr:hypothetical protein [Microbacterium proteolyticum]MBB3158658.1 hypothetical protein [Microbacterium proteolyticum]